jgi:hypothetical protein
MKRKSSTVLVLALMGLASSAFAAYYVAGGFNGWNPAGLLMTDNQDGTYTAVVSGLVAGSRHEFKVTDGTWTWSYPSPNSWFYADASGKITLTFNTNIVSDGWQPQQNRLGVSSDPGTWTIAGSFQGWNNTNPATAMTSLGGDFYMFSQTLSAGSHQFKPVVTGTWDSIAADNRSVGTANMVLDLSSTQVVNIYVDALVGRVGVGINIADITRDYLPHNPSPANSEKDVLVSGLGLSWAVAQERSKTDPNVFIADPNLLSHKLYMSDGSGTDPNLYYVDTIAGWDAETLRASYIPSPDLNKDSVYQWRVDMVMNDSNDIAGIVWTFKTELTTPQITSDPGYQVVGAGTTAVFSVTVNSPSTVLYTWYKYVDGISDTLLANGGDISGADTNQLSIANVELADEGAYYCVVNNESGIPDISKKALLGVKRLLARWDFESGNANSTVAGSPASDFYNNPELVISGGISGDGMEFDNDPDAEDILYTDPDESSYFDICNYTMTAACWIKSSFAATWGPMIARNGEEGQGWQLRHRGDTLDRICFTTRGTGNDDGRASNRTVYDGNWHYVAATYDGAFKKVYIDGVIMRVYNGDDGSIASDSEQAAGLIASTPSPVALAGRVKGDPINGLIFEGGSVTPCILDEVEIYNYALDAATIAQTYANMTETAVCPAPLIYDLDGDCIVNLNDFTKLASQWLTDTSVQPVP